MPTTRRPLPVKLFAGLLGGDPGLLRRARQLLVRRFGPLDLESEVWPFDQTDYYEPEMGPDLKRCFLSFETPIDPGALAGIKCATCALERQLAEDCALPSINRPVNIDPGYVGLGQLVLATTKDAAHRIYLGHRVYAEVTLHYQDGAWRTSPWTYPDYGRPETHAFFASVRELFLQQRRETMNLRDLDEADA